MENVIAPIGTLHRLRGKKKRIRTVCFSKQPNALLMQLSPTGALSKSFHNIPVGTIKFATSVKDMHFEISVNRARFDSHIS